MKNRREKAVSYSFFYGEFTDLGPTTNLLGPVRVLGFWTCWKLAENIKLVFLTHTLVLNVAMTKHLIFSNIINTFDLIVDFQTTQILYIVERRLVFFQTKDYCVVGKLCLSFTTYHYNAQTKVGQIKMHIISNFILSILWIKRLDAFSCNSYSILSSTYLTFSHIHTNLKLI